MYSVILGHNLICLEKKQKRRGEKKSDGEAAARPQTFPFVFLALPPTPGAYSSEMPKVQFFSPFVQNANLFAGGQGKNKKSLAGTGWLSPVLSLLKTCCAQHPTI